MPFFTRKDKKPLGIYVHIPFCKSKCHYCDFYSVTECGHKLQESYRKAIEELETNTGATYEKLYIVGGGAKNTFLNKLTEETTGKQVIALPIEATALGNLKVQMEVK